MMKLKTTFLELQFKPYNTFDQPKLLMIASVKLKLTFLKL